MRLDHLLSMETKDGKHLVLQGQQAEMLDLKGNLNRCLILRVRVNLEKGKVRNFKDVWSDTGV